MPGASILRNCTFSGCDAFSIWVENSRDRLQMYNCIMASGNNIGLCFEQSDISNYRGDYNIFYNNNSYRAVVVGYETEFSLE